MSETIETPWTSEQISRLQAWQDAWWVHPYTSHDGISLTPTTDGWVCPCGCDYRQQWAWNFSVPPNPFDSISLNPLS